MSNVPKSLRAPVSVLKFMAVLVATMLLSVVLGTLATVTFQSEFAGFVVMFGIPILVLYGKYLEWKARPEA